MEKALKKILKLVLMFVAIVTILLGNVDGARRLKSDCEYKPLLPEACIVNPNCCSPIMTPPS